MPTTPVTEALMTDDKLERLAGRAGMYTDLMRMGAGSLLYSQGCHGVTLANMKQFAALVLADALDAKDAEIEALRADAERLDYLDTRNARKNERNGTIYGWWLNENDNRIALEDHDWRKLSAREAIDAARATVTAKETR